MSLSATKELSPAELERFHAHAAEQAVLGAILLSSDAAGIAIEILGDKPEVFASEPHRILYAAMLGLYHDGRPIDPLILKERLIASGRLREMGGLSYIADLSSEVPTSSNVKHYARIVYERWAKEKLRNVGNVTADDQNLADLITAAHAELDALEFKDTDSRQPADVRTMFESLPVDREFLFANTIPCGVLAGLDAAGGSGKSMLCQQLALSLSAGRVILDHFRPTRACPVLWFTSEDDAGEIHRRLRRILNGYDEDLDAVARHGVVENLSIWPGRTLPLVDDDEGTVRPTTHYRWLRREIKRRQPGLVILDPRAHFISVDENDNSAVAAAMGLLRDLTRIADEGTTILLVHHVSKQRQGEADSAAGRGASSARDSMRIIYSLTPPTPTEIADLGITDPTLYVRLQAVKSNYGPQAASCVFLRRGATPDDGGVLYEIDAGEQRAQIASGQELAVARELAQLLGAESEFSERDITKAQACVELRDKLKAKFGRAASRDRLAESIARGVRLGILACVPIDTGQRPKTVIRKASREHEAVEE